MEGFEVSPVELRFATEPGALDAYTAECSCGLVIRNAFESEAKRDASDHAEWHDLQADVLRRTLAQLDCSGLRAALARQDRTRGWLS